MQQAWQAAGPQPGILLGGTAAASFARAVRGMSQGRWRRCSACPYGPDYFDLARADTLTDNGQIHAELLRLSAGCSDVLLFPCASGLDQVALLAEAVHTAGPTSGVHD